MLDCEKPRRPRWEEQREIDDVVSRERAEAEARSLLHFSTPSLSALVQEYKEKEEEEFRERERRETGRERAESEHILLIEAEIDGEMPSLRAKQIQRTFVSRRRL
jgi:hypothetical protein